MHLERTLKQPLHDAKVPLMRRKGDVVGQSSDAEEVFWFPNTNCLPSDSFPEPQNRNDAVVKSVLNGGGSGEVGGATCKTSFATARWNPCAVRARCFVPWKAGVCLPKQKCGTTRRCKKSPPVLWSARPPRRRHAPGRKPPATPAAAAEP